VSHHRECDMSMPTMPVGSLEAMHLTSRLSKTGSPLPGSPCFRTLDGWQKYPATTETMIYPPVEEYSNVRTYIQYPRGSTNNRTAQCPAIQVVAVPRGVCGFLPSGH